MKSNYLIATTKKFDSNLIFELGRRYGLFGRIYNHTIMVSHNLLISENQVKGWAFIPQEGNTILSNIEAFLKMTKSDQNETIFNALKSELLVNKW